MLTGLLIQLIVSNQAGVEGYGIWSLFMNLVLVFTTLADWGVAVNGARLMQLSTGKIWLAHAQFWRIRLSIFFALLFIITVFSFYQGASQILIWGFPMILFSGFLLDWYERGRHRPEKAATRQIAQSILQLLAIVVLFKLKSSLSWIIGSYALIAVSTYFAMYTFSEKTEFKSSSAWSWLSSQLPIIAGFGAYHITYNLPLFLLGYVGTQQELGIYASHYILYTSLATFGVITMDIFLAKLDRKGYLFWLILVTLAGVIMILASGWYYPYLFAQKGYKWDQTLALIMAGLCIFHVMRIYFFSEFLYAAQQQKYGYWNALGLLLHICFFGFYMLSAHSYDLISAGFLLLSAEGFLIAILLIRKMISCV